MPQEAAVRPASDREEEEEEEVGLPAGQPPGLEEAQTPARPAGRTCRAARARAGPRRKPRPSRSLQGRRVRPRTPKAFL